MQGRVRGAAAPTAERAPARFSHHMPFGAEIDGEGVRFRLWAPDQERIELKLEGSGDLLPLRAGSDGWHGLTTGRAVSGSRYRFQLTNGQLVSDPASRFQPEDVHGPSEVVEPRSFAWTDPDWIGRPWHETVLYELHVGAFTEQGTFKAAIERLDALAELGVTAIELMPVADFPGRRNWGYDGVLPFAPDSSYGRPEDLKALVDAAHGKGLMVLLDVVYNHFGPDGNYLPLYAPIFTTKHQTPWGPAVNFDGPGSEIVRELVVHNALYWLEEYRFDGLRFDAVHSIIDESRGHILELIASRIRERDFGRQIHLVLENEENDTRRLERSATGKPLLYTAQWNDDLHHALHAAASGEESGYYADYAGDTEKLGRALAEGFAFQGEVMQYRGTARGRPSAHLPSTAFVSFVQNHDQVGNRAFGERLISFCPKQAVRAVAAVYLLAPQIPLIFMGEEWGVRQPFPFFCDFSGELAEAVRKGRRQEFAKFPDFQDPQRREQIPDPNAIDTFLSAKLDWTEADKGDSAAWRKFYQAILRVRHREIVPRLGASAGHAGSYRVLGPGAVSVAWRLCDGSALTLTANLSPEPLDATLPTRGRTLWQPAKGRTLWQEGDAREGALGPWSVAWRLADADQA